MEAEADAVPIVVATIPPPEEVAVQVDLAGMRAAEEVAAPAERGSRLAC